MSERVESFSTDCAPGPEAAAETQKKTPIVEEEWTEEIHDDAASFSLDILSILMQQPSINFRRMLPDKIVIFLECELFSLPSPSSKKQLSLL